MIKAGLVGLGYWGPNLARNISTNPQFHLAALCDSDKSRLERIGRIYPAAARFENFEDMLSCVDAVAIATPVRTHYALAKSALLAGKHVLVEKPMAETGAAARELVAIAAERRLVLAVDHTYLFTGAVKKMKEIVASGELGELLYFDSVRINLGLFQHDVNVIWDLAPHDLSILYYLFGRMPESVVALGSTHTPRGIADVAYINMDFGGSLSANLHVNWLSPVKIRHMIIAGSKKMMLFDDLNVDEKLKIYDRGIELKAEREQVYEALLRYRIGDVRSPKLDEREALSSEMDNFSAAILNDQPLVSGGDLGSKIVEILEASNQSLQQGGLRTGVNAPTPAAARS